MVFTDPTAMDLEQTLARQLIPLADDLRDLQTQFGLRPYKVRAVRVAWSGGKRGRGSPVVRSELVILPVPSVQDLSSLQAIVTPVGLDEVGSILVSEISGRFTDDELRFVDADGLPPAPDEEVFYEIEFPRTDGKPGERRRFHVRSAPFYDAAQLQWSIRLERAHEDRARNGDV